MKQKLTIIKVGGKIVENPESLSALLDCFSGIEGKKILIHGGGRSATALAEKLGVETYMVEGRRVTSPDMLRIAVMVYAGWVNKSIVAGLQRRDINAAGLCGADFNTIKGHRRPVVKVDYGEVGDVDFVDPKPLLNLLQNGYTPVIAPIIHNGDGNLLNTNADTIASETASAVAPFFNVELTYCFEKPGVLLDPDDDSSVISLITPESAAGFIEKGIISGGMLPKIHTALKSLERGVEKVVITNAENIGVNGAGTTIQR